MDALTHAVESYLSTLGTPATRAMSLAAARVIVRDLPRVYEDGRDVAARQSLAVASCQAAWPSPRRAWGTFMPFRTRSARAITCLMGK